MGHAEMLLAVAGMDEVGIEELVQRLAAGAWDTFPPEQRTLFAVACRLTREPSTMTATDRAALVDAFGPVRAVDWVWLIAWGNYMTSVADALQLPLEGTNVFEPPRGAGG
jgi:alkylhydroperoxidase family enzyme